MIRNETEYQEAVRRLAEEKERLEAHKERLLEAGLSSAEVKRALDPLRSFQAQLEEEIDCYSGSSAATSPRSSTSTARRVVGRAADRARHHAARACRAARCARVPGLADERNDYHGITVERAERVLAALDVQMNSSFDLAARVPSRARRQRRAGE